MEFLLHQYEQIINVNLPNDDNNNNDNFCNQIKNGIEKKLEKKIILLGKVNSGKNEIIEYLDDPMKNIKDINLMKKKMRDFTYGYDYSCFERNNEIVDVYKFQNEEFLEFLNFVIKDFCDFENTICMINVHVLCFNNIVEEFENWIEKLKENIENIISKLLKRNENVKDEVSMIEKLKKRNLKRLQRVYLKNNFLFPIIFIVSNTDRVNRLSKKKEELLETSKRLNKIVYDYGGSLIHVSMANNTNCKIMNDLVDHFLFKKSFNYQCDKSNYESIFIPYYQKNMNNIAHKTLMKQFQQRKTQSTVDVRKLNKKKVKNEIRKNKGKVPVQCFQKFLKRMENLKKLEKFQGNVAPTNRLLKKFKDKYEGSFRKNEIKKDRKQVKNDLKNALKRINSKSHLKRSSVSSTPVRPKLRRGTSQIIRPSTANATLPKKRRKRAQIYRGNKDSKVEDIDSFFTNVLDSLDVKYDRIMKK